MSSFIVNLLIPTLMASSLYYFRMRHIWAWAWVTVVWDLDYLGWILFKAGVIGVNLHRALGHNIWWLLGLLAGAYVSFRRFAQASPGPRLAAFHAWNQTFSGAGWTLSSFYYFSHILFDSFQGGIAILWPLGLLLKPLDFTLAWSFDIVVDTTTHEPQVEADVSAPAGVVDVSEVYLWLSSEEFAYVVLFAMICLANYLYRRTTVRLVQAVRVAPRPKE